MRKLFLFCTLLSVMNFSFNLPAHAENAAQGETNPELQKVLSKVEDAKKKLKEKLQTSKFDRLKVLDAKGNLTTLERILSNSNAMSEGFSISVGDERYEVHGEPVNGSIDQGLRLYFTKFLNEKSVTGHVITLAPGITVHELEQRFKDAALSMEFSRDIGAKQKKMDRATASATAVSCAFGMAVLVVSVAASVHIINLALKERGIASSGLAAGFSIIISGLLATGAVIGGGAAVQAGCS